MNDADDRIVVITASGRLSRSDYEQFVPRFERLAVERRPMRILVQLEDFHGWDLPALWQELTFDISHQNDMGRVAIVGDRAWQAWGSRFSKPFFKAEIRFFRRSETQEARVWLTAA